MQHRTVKSKGFDGLGRSYTFKLLSAEEGLEFFHSEEFNTYGITCKEIVDSLNSDNDKEPDGFTAFALIQAFLSHTDWEKEKELFAKFIGGAVIDYGQTDTETVGEDGICEYAAGNPVEQYLTFSQALFANFPTYSPFFGEILVSAQKEMETEEKTEGDESSTPSEEQPPDSSTVPDGGELTPEQWRDGQSRIFLTEKNTPS